MGAAQVGSIIFPYPLASFTSVSTFLYLGNGGTAGVGSKLSHTHGCLAFQYRMVVIMIRQKHSEHAL